MSIVLTVASPPEHSA